MFKRAGSSLAPHLRRLHTRSSASADVVNKNIRRNPRAVALASTVIVGSVLWYTTNQKVYNDAQSSSAVSSSSKGPTLTGNELTNDHSDTLHSLVWGSNRSKTLLPNGQSDEPIRAPAVAGWLEGVALRDLALHERHGACVDARGDVYQWGDGFFGQEEPGNRMPHRTLRGKNIVNLQLTEAKLFALSASGKIYVLATDAKSQELRPGVPTPSSDSWWGTGWLWGEDETVDFVQIAPREPLGWGESFVAIAAGKNHLLAVTSKGRTYGLPVNKAANEYGQLGFRRFDIPDPASRITHNAAHLHVELVPKSLLDPYRKSSRAIRAPSTGSSSNNILSNVDDTSIRFCPTIFEIPVLQGVDVAQVAAGGRSSFARTTDGRVLGWGANEYGQIGLGSVPLDTITVPTEVVLWRMVPSKIRSKCQAVTAGGDLTAFTMERVSDVGAVTLDLLLAGNGQYGGLGNNTYSNAQGQPTRVKAVSGLLQYNDGTRRLEPVAPEAISISPTGHILVALDSSVSSGGVGGKDLMTWGKNYDSELGNGKKASVPVPMTLETPDGGRFMLMEVQAKEVKDLHGKVWKRGIKVEQHAVAGYGNSAVYWKIAT